MKELVCYKKGTNNLFQSQTYEKEEEKLRIINSFKKDAKTNNIEIDIIVEDTKNFY
jgi:hypothetical protein